MTNVKASFLRNNLPEVIFYLVCWILVLAVPIFLEAYDSAIDGEITFQWVDIGYAYVGYVPFLICFLIGKLVLEPRLFFAGHYGYFIVSTLLVAFLVASGFSYLTPDRRSRHHERHRLEQLQAEREALRDSIAQSQTDSVAIATGINIGRATPHPHPIVCPPMRRHQHNGEDRRRKPLSRGLFMPMFFMTLLLMVASLGVAITFRFRRDQLDLKEKQAARLQSELDYLKYQINPHFFMNTLNNIHALVDIDGELAKEAIIELSRMMRYLLYESNHPTVPLQKELDFMQQYLELMRLRCDDSVTISYESPIQPDVALQTGIPPMLLISFIENAFKHGISSQDSSYIQVSIQCEDQCLHFHCHNSNFNQNSNRRQLGGVGLDNVRKRLELLYPGQYTLQIVPTEADFTVDLWLPM